MKAIDTHSMWLRNCGYLVAWDREVPTADLGQLFHRRVLVEPILVYRSTDQNLSAGDGFGAAAVPPRRRGAG